jgi:hypothetical protein
MPFGYTWGDLGNAGLAGLDGPRQAVWNLGPTLVGRSGQGPKTGAEMLGRLGMEERGPAAQGFGKAIDLIANPMNLAGMGMLNRATAARSVAPEAAALTTRLERMAGSGLQQAEQAAARRTAQATGASAPPLQGAPTSIARPVPPLASPGAGFRLDPAQLRVDQLNSPLFNPNLPVYGLGTPAFSQTAPAAAPATSVLLNRLQRLIPPAGAAGAAGAALGGMSLGGMSGSDDRSIPSTLAY